MKRIFISVLLLALPILAFGQNTYIPTGYDGSPEYYWSGYVAGDEHIDLITPVTSQFTLDSVQVLLYRGMTGGATTLTFNIRIYDNDNIHITGDCGCTTGPGTLLGTYGPFTATGTTQYYPNFRKVDVNPNLLITGPFYVALEYVSISGGTAWPSILSDNENNPPPCCEQYFEDQTAGEFQDNDYYSGGAGWFYMGVFGVGSGQALPGELSVADLLTMGTAMVDSTVDDTLVLNNIGGTTLTVLSVVSDNADFTADPIGAGIVIAPDASALLPIHYTPSAEGDASATFTFTDDVPASLVTTHSITGRGISTTNLVFHENFWNVNTVNDGWMQFRFDSLASQDWGFYYSGAHEGGEANVWAGHYYAAADSYVTDLFGTPLLTAPAGGTVTINFREMVEYYPTYYDFHGLCLADTDTTWSVIAELIPAGDDVWVDYPTTWYVTGLDSEYVQFMLGFLYQGADADNWHLDDILIKDVPPAPPFLTSEPRGDAFASDQELVADAFDPNSDPFVVEAHIEEVTATFTAYTMPETAVGSGHFCLNFTEFLTGAGTYNYYITATDDDGVSRFPETGSYQFEVQAQTGATEIIYHDGIWENAHYYNNFNSEDAVRFTPAAYPFILTGANVGILNLFPNAVHEQIVVKVYDDDGPGGGLPGTLLYEGTTGSIGNECDGLGETYAMFNAAVVFHTDLTFTDGTFYISVKNPSDGVAGFCEAWCLDTLGAGNSYYYDATNDLWAPTAEEDGDVMISALGYSVTDPILTLYADPVNTTASIYVHSAPGVPISGVLPFPLNLYVSTSPGGAQSLVGGSPFASSPISVPTTVDPRDFFTGKYVYGPVDLMREIPNEAPDYITTSVITPAPAGIGVANLSGAAVNFDPTVAVPSAVDFRIPTLVTLNDNTGEKQIASLNRKLGKAMHARSLSESAVRGPVREFSPERTSFESAR